MATLTNTQISVTYVGLLKTSANTVLSSTAQQITDGSGNNSILFLSTAGVGIGGAAASGKELDVTGNVQITGDLIVDNIQIDGSTIGHTSDTDLLTLASGQLTVAGHIGLPDSKEIKLGTDADFKIYHNNTDAYIQNYTGDLIIENNANDKDIIFKSDDGSGGVTEYFRVDGGTERVESSKSFRFADGARAQFGTSSDMQIYHSSGNSFIQNGTGSLVIEQTSGAIALRPKTSENGVLIIQDGAVELYHDNSKKFETTSAGVTITGSVTTNTGSGSAILGSHLDLGDNQKARFGASQDLEIYHDGSNSFVQDRGTGGLFLEGNGEVRIRKSETSEIMGKFIADGAVELYHDNSKKLETTSTGISVTGGATATGSVTTSSSDGFVITDIGRMKMSSNSLFIETETNGTGIVLNSRTGFVTFQNNGTQSFQMNSSNNATFAGTISSGAITSSASITASGNSNSFGNTTITALSATSGTFSGSVTATGNSNSFGTTTFTGNVIIDGFDNSKYLSLRASVCCQDPAGSGGVGLKALDHSGASADGLGVYGHDGISFFVGQSERARIDNSGNLLIGTTTADGKLNIESAGTAINFTRSGQETYKIVHGVSGLFISLNGTNLTGHTQNHDFKVFNTSGSAFVTADGSVNRLGVRTEVPQSTVHIVGVSNDTVSQANANLNVEGAGGNGLVVGTIASAPYSTYIQSGFVDNFSTAVYPLVLNPLGGSVEIGFADQTEQKLRIHGQASGSPEGGQIELHTAADHDSTYAFYRIDAYEDDLRIGREGTTDITLQSTGNVVFGGNITLNTATLSGSVFTEFIKSNSSVRIDIDNDNNQTDRSFLVSKDNAGTELMRINEDGNIGVSQSSPISNINSGSFFKPDSSGRFLTINGAANGSFIMLESSSTTDDDQIGGVYFTATSGQGDAHKQVAGIDAIVYAHGTTSLNGADLRFFTKPAGAGQTTPALILEHNSNASFSGDVTIGSTTSSSTVLNLTKSSTGVSEIKFLNVANEKASIQLDAAEDLQIFANTSQKIKLRSGGADTLTLNTDQSATFAGDVTINGTLSGAGSFVPVGGGTFTGDVTISKAATPLFKLLDTTNNVNLLLGADDTNTFLRGSSGSLIFQTNGANAALTLDDSQGAVFAANVFLGDGKKLNFGAAPDFEIFHNNTSNVNVITSLLSRQMNIQSDTLNITNQAASTTYLGFASGGAATFSGRVSVGTGVTGNSTSGGQLIIDSSNSFKQLSFSSDVSGETEGVTGMVFVDDTGNNQNDLRIGGGLGENNAMSKIRFFTASNNTTRTGTERMRIQGTGEVGIGTTSPENLLHIKASDGVTGVLKIEGGKNTVTSVGEINSQLDFGSNDGSVWSSGNVGGRIASVTEATNGAFVGMAFSTFRQGASAPDSLSEKMRITNDGNVGINTTQPSYKLDIISVGADAINVGAGNDFTGVRWTGDNHAFSWRIGGDSFFIYDVINAAQRVTIKDNGNVGIGEDAPDNKLHVKGGSTTRVKIESSGTNTGILLNEQGTDRYSIASTSNGTFQIFSEVASVNRLSISSAGDVQIGSSGTSNLYFGNTISASSADRGMRIHTNNANVFFDFQGEANDELFFRDYDGSGGIHTRHEFGISNGALIIAGGLTQNGSPSDIKYKENIKTISNGIDKIEKLNPVEFDWNDKSDAHKIGKKEDAGFIAQEVQKVLPNLVNENVDGDLVLNYQGIIPYLVQSIQELKKEIEILKSK